MRIFFDARFTRFPEHDGISRYGACLLAALATLHPVTAIIDDQRQREMLTGDADYVQLNAPTSPAELGLGRRLNELGAQALFSPMQVTGAVGRKFRLVLTLHDLIYYRYRVPPRDQPLVVRAG